MGKSHRQGCEEGEWKKHDGEIKRQWKAPYADLKRYIAEALRCSNKVSYPGCKIEKARVESLCYDTTLA